MQYPFVTASPSKYTNLIGDGEHRYLQQKCRYIFYTGFII